MTTASAYGFQVEISISGICIFPRVKLVLIVASLSKYIVIKITEGRKLNALLTADFISLHLWIKTFLN